MPPDIDKDLLMRRVAAYLAVLIVGGFFGVLTLLAVHVVPPENKDAFGQLLGALTLAFGGLMGYLYGSSKNAESQNRTITSVALGAPPNGIDSSKPTGTPSDPGAVTEVKQ